MNNELFVRLTKPHIDDADWLQPERFSDSLTRDNVLMFIDADLSPGCPRFAVRPGHRVIETGTVSCIISVLGLLASVVALHKRGSVSVPVEVIKKSRKTFTNNLTAN